MAGSSTRNKSDGSGYQRNENGKSDFSSRSRTSFDNAVKANQRINNYTPKGDREQSVNRTGKGSRLAGPLSGALTSWMGSQKPKVAAAPKPKVKPVVPAVRKPTTINVPGGGLATGKKASSGPMSTKQAQSMKPGNYSNKSVSMGGKTYNGFTVGSRTDSKGRTTKSVGNWTSAPSRNSGSTASKSVSSSRASNPANSRNMKNW
ncbi:MAG: hypothetical protein ABFE08_17850 [Armatimonadia bacterium]